MQGRFVCVNKQPKMLERLKTYGIDLDPAVFEETLDVNQ